MTMTTAELVNKIPMAVKRAGFYWQNLTTTDKDELNQHVLASVPLDRIDLLNHMVKTWLRDRFPVDPPVEPEPEEAVEPPADVPPSPEPIPAPNPEPNPNPEPKPEPKPIKHAPTTMALTISTTDAKLILAIADLVEDHQ